MKKTDKLWLVEEYWAEMRLFWEIKLILYSFVFINLPSYYLYNILLLDVSEYDNVLARGRHTGRTRFVNVTDLRRRNRAMSWLYVLTSKLRCLIMLETARITAGDSVVENWSWSPRNTRIFDLFNLMGQLKC